MMISQSTHDRVDKELPLATVPTAQGDAAYYQVLDELSKNQGRGTVIAVQPHNHAYTNRIPIPISIVDQNDVIARHSIPLNGLQLLNGLDRVCIQQTVELDDLFTVIESENRYTVKKDGGGSVYGALEHSSSWQRLLCGSRRSYTMRLFDRSQQEAMFFNRRLSCSIGLCGCYLQRVDVFTPPCEYIGSVRQEWTPLKPSFLIYDGSNTPIYRVTCATKSPCCVNKDAIFDVTNPDNTVHVTRISHEWDENLNNFNLTCHFPSPNLCYKRKGLLLACSFLLEYVFFETSKTNRCTSCCC